MRLFCSWLLTLSCLALQHPAVGAATPIIAADYLETSPHRELIEYALKVTEAEYGPATLTFSGEMVQGRAEQLLKDGKLLHLVVLKHLYCVFLAKEIFGIVLLLCRVILIISFFPLKIGFYSIYYGV